MFSQSTLMVLKQNKVRNPLLSKICKVKMAAVRSPRSSSAILNLWVTTPLGASRNSSTAVK